MPIVPNYMQQVNAQNWSEGLGSVVQALNNPQAFANADLLRAHKDYYGAQTQKTLADILNEKQLNAAKITTEGAHAGYYVAGSRNQDAQTAQIQQQTSALKDMEPALVQAGVDPNTAHLGGLIFQGGGRNSTTENNADALIKLFRPDMKLAPGETAVLTQQGPLPSPLLPQQGQQPAQTTLPSQTATQPNGLGTALSGGTQINGNMITAPGAPSRQMTPGEKALDEAFAKDYAEAINTGNIGDAEKQIINLRQAIENLRSGAASTGPIEGRLPDFITQMYQDKQKGLVPTRDAVQESVQRTLRAVLGGQFAQQEGVELMRRSFNPTLPNEEIARRVSLLANSLEQGLGVRKDAINYFKTQGSLKGWNGQLPNRASIESGAKNPDLGSRLTSELTPGEQAELAALRAKHKR